MTSHQQKRKSICDAERSAENAQPVPMGHKQIPQHLLAVLATDSLELEVPQSEIKELIYTHEPHSRSINVFSH